MIWDFAGDPILEALLADIAPLAETVLAELAELLDDEATAPHHRVRRMLFAGALPTARACVTPGPSCRPCRDQRQLPAARSRGASADRLRPSSNVLSMVDGSRGAKIAATRTSELTLDSPDELDYLFLDQYWNIHTLDVLSTQPFQALL